MALTLGLRRRGGFAVVLSERWMMCEDHDLRDAWKQVGSSQDHVASRLVIHAYFCALRVDSSEQRQDNVAIVACDEVKEGRYPSAKQIQLIQQGSIDGHVVEQLLRR